MKTSCDICFENKDDTYKYCCSKLCNRETLNKQIRCNKCEVKHNILDINNCEICKKNMCKPCCYFYH